jgi:hypothetical protein
MGHRICAYCKQDISWSDFERHEADGISITPTIGEPRDTFWHTKCLGERMAKEIMDKLFVSEGDK